jgi:nitrogen regulatory protein P-II 1
MKKNLTLIVHADVQQSLADALRRLEAVAGFTFTHVEGHGSQSHHDTSLSARDLVVGYVPRVRVDVLVEDDMIETVLAALAPAGMGVAGRGVYWVTPVERFGRL